MNTRCVVVGAGIIGSCIALRLSRGGAQVTVVEASQPGYGATANSFAWIGASHPGLHEPEPYFLLNALGVQAYRRLEAELDLGPWVSHPGCLTWSTDAAEQATVAANVEFLSRAGYNAVALPPEQASRDLDPGIRVPAATEHVAFFADEGYVSGPPFVGRILDHACAAGVGLASGQKVAGLVTAGKGVTGVRLASGEILAADIVVIACGRGSAELLRTVAYELPLVSPDPMPSAAVGLLVISRPLAVPIRRVLIADDIMIRPDGGGRLIMHDYRIDALVQQDTPVMPLPGPALQLMRATARHVRCAPQVDVESARIGIRSLPADGLPIVGRVPGQDSLYTCVTHSGVNLAPLLAELIAAEILHEDNSSLLAAFRPERFAAGAA